MCTRPSTISLKSLHIRSLSPCKPSSIRFLKVLFSQYSIWMYKYCSLTYSALDSFPVSCRSTPSSEPSDLKKEKKNEAGLFPKHPVTLWSRASANVFYACNNTKTYPAMGTLKFLLAPCFLFFYYCFFFFLFLFLFFVFFQLDNESSKQSRLQFYVNRNMFSYQRLSWRLDKNSLSRKPRNSHSQPCLQPLPRFLICKALHFHT